MTLYHLKENSVSQEGNDKSCQILSGHQEIKNTKREMPPTSETSKAVVTCSNRRGIHIDTLVQAHFSDATEDTTDKIKPRKISN